MKWSTRILIAMFIIMVLGLVISNIILKKAFDKLDKSDTYWNFGKVFEQPFKYLKIDGGNVTQIAFEQSPHYSVRVLHEWQRIRGNPIESFVKNDTLYLHFTFNTEDEGESNWMKHMTLVRIFSPELLYVGGVNTNFGMFKLRQKNLSVNMSGRSTFEVESFIPNLDSLSIIQKDSSEVVFEMSPEYKPIVTAAKTLVAIEAGKSQSNEAMTIQSVNANLEGHTLLDIGHAQIQSLKLNIADTSGIILSGGTLQTFRRQKF